MFLFALFPSTLSQFHKAMKPTACNHSGKSPATRRDRRGLEFLTSPIHRKLSLLAMSGGSLENSSTKLSLFVWLWAHSVQTACYVLFCFWLGSGVPLVKNNHRQLSNIVTAWGDGQYLGGNNRIIKKSLQEKTGEWDIHGDSLGSSKAFLKNQKATNRHILCTCLENM